MVVSVVGVMKLGRMSMFVLFKVFLYWVKKVGLVSGYLFVWMILFKDMGCFLIFGLVLVWYVILCKLCLIVVCKDGFDKCKWVGFC